jgi:hypothetical protein
LLGFPGGTWQIVTLGTAAWAEATPSPSFAVAASTAAVGLDCLSALQPKSTNVTAQITDNRAGMLLFMADPLCPREGWKFKAYPGLQYASIFWPGPRSK